MWFVEYFYQIISSWASLIFMDGAHLDQKKALTYKSGDHQLRESGYPSIHKILYIPGDCWGFLPSTVVANCQVFFLNLEDMTSVWGGDFYTVMIYTPDD